MHCFTSAISILIIYLLPSTVAKEPVKLVEDDEFLAFVKNPSNFWQCKTLKKRDELEYRINRVTYGFKQMREHLIHKYEAYLGVLYLMRQCWQCAKIVEQIKGEHERTECHKFRKYLDILYEYLFRIYVEGRGVDAMLAQHVAAVKPQFKLHQRRENIDNGTLLGVIKSLSEISRFFFGPIKSAFYKWSLNRLFQSDLEPKLINEKEYETNDAANLNDSFRQQFDRDLKRMLKETKESERIEKDELKWERGQKEKNELKQKPPRMERSWRTAGRWVRYDGISECERKRNIRINAYSDKFGIFNSSPFKRSIILLDELGLLLALFNDPPTFYEVLKMAKILGEMDDDFYILLNSSNLKRIFKRLNREEEPIDKIEIQIKNEFCALANFVGDLLENAKAEEVLKVESIKVYIGNFLEKKELCKGKKKQKKIKKSLDGKDLYNGKTPKDNFNPINDLKQIIPAIVDEIEQMLQNGDWNYANLTYIKLDEWILLKYDLLKMGNDQKWKEIEQLLIEWEKAFSNWWSDNKNEENRPNFEEIMGNLIKILRDIIIQHSVIEIVEESEQTQQKSN